MRDYHVVFTAADATPASIAPQVQWIGYELENPVQLFDEIGLRAELTQKVRDLLLRSAYPRNQARMGSMLVRRTKRKSSRPLFAKRTQIKNVNLIVLCYGAGYRPWHQQSTA